ncbi:UvrD-helicase domain-containing protein [Oceanisphaera pacifica]|uniref:DNA 3'-5' helicase n=1 Tax=Oceanisphaera pacifica TaxID=2818389 RepID=A0ABS3NDP5_9GAMM|nr:UvrD-helicase domain-containing protein [Oceanisphaera pacifica]MBO1518401.1 UvrD-helicase domain-containing protein [Oceanisphaera pacifica]
MQVFRAHWLAPWFNHPFLACEITHQGLVLHLKNERHSLTWQDLTAPPARIKGWRFYRLHLYCAQGDLELAWLPKPVADALYKLLTLTWYQVLAARALPLATQCLQLLEQGYLRQSRWQQLQKLLATLEPAAGKQAINWASLTPPAELSDREAAAIGLLSTLITADEAWREHCCAEYCQQMLTDYADLFDSLETHPLTDAQRLACVVDEDANLVLAGAGCGKTSVMMARAAFLVASHQAKPQELLLLAFGNEAASEMSDRLARHSSTSGVHARTFHALGLMILSKVEGAMPTLSPLAQQDSARVKALANWLAELCQQDESYRQALYGWLKNKRISITPEPDYHKLAREWAPIVAALKLYGEPNLTDLSPELAAQLSLILPLLHRYQHELAEQGKIDFDDMIEQATDFIRQGRFSVPWRYILVDEFQDISGPRAHLLQALRDAAPELSLFCVGDDWQAIYRFSGGDVRLTTRFADTFGASRITRLDKTFRFNNQIEQVASRFVQQNPEQLTKTLTTHTQSASPCVHVLPVTAHGQTEAISRLLGQIAAEQPQASVYLLARFRFSLPDLAQLTAWRKRFVGLEIVTQTVHAAKGKEADHVIMLGLGRGKYGFPPEQSTTGLLERLLPETDSFAYAEERRLFYVGLTRARQQVFLLADAQQPSVFIKELTSGGYPSVSKWG